MAKKDVHHQDGCPKERVVQVKRRFIRKGSWLRASKWRCTDCGGEDGGTKPKKWKEVGE